MQRLRRGPPDRRVRIVKQAGERGHGAFVTDFTERGSRKLTMTPLGIVKHFNQPLNAIPVSHPAQTANRPQPHPFRFIVEGGA